MGQIAVDANNGLIVVEDRPRGGRMLGGARSAPPSTSFVTEHDLERVEVDVGVQHKEAVELPLRLDLVGIKAKRSPATVLRWRRKPALPMSALSPLACWR